MLDSSSSFSFVLFSPVVSNPGFQSDLRFSSFWGLVMCVHAPCALWGGTQACGQSNEDGTIRFGWVAVWLWTSQTDSELWLLCFLLVWKVALACWGGGAGLCKSNHVFGPQSFNTSTQCQVHGRQSESCCSTERISWRILPGVQRTHNVCICTFALVNWFMHTCNTRISCFFKSCVYSPFIATCFVRLDHLGLVLMLCRWQ